MPVRMEAASRSRSSQLCSSERSWIFPPIRGCNALYSGCVTARNRVQFFIRQITDAGGKPEAEQVAKPKHVIGKAGRIGLGNVEKGSPTVFTRLQLIPPGAAQL